MLLFPIITQTALATECAQRYQGIAFDGCHFYLTVSHCCRIIKSDRCFHRIDSINTCRPYTSICYDVSEDCFWAAGCHAALYKLNACLQEIDCIPIPSCKDAKITGVSYDCSEDTLLVAFSNHVVKVEKQGCQTPQIIQEACWCTGILSLAPAWITTTIHNGKQQICLSTSENKCIQEFSVPKDYLIETILFDPCAPQACSDSYHFILLATKHGYSYLLEAAVCPSSLGVEPYCCNFLLSEKPCKPHADSCDKNGCNDIIESVALMEASLAHILNAEGEKLQKVIACTDDPCMLLSVNKAVTQTVIQVSHLEHLLYDKLSLIQEHCSQKCDCDCIEPPIDPC